MSREVLAASRQLKVIETPIAVMKMKTWMMNRIKIKTRVKVMQTTMALKRWSRRKEESETGEEKTK